MKSIQKHEFEAVSLLTVENGLLELVSVPVADQPDWLLPSQLILEIKPFDEQIWSYLWQQKDDSVQEVAVYRLLPDDKTPDKLVIVEGNTDIHRVGLLTAGAVKTLKVRMSDVQDLDNDNDNRNEFMLKSSKPQDAAHLDYVYQQVNIGGVPYVVPDMDKLAHHLVDLDG